jgi:hypothetical protein
LLLCCQSFGGRIGNCAALAAVAGKAAMTKINKGLSFFQRCHLLTTIIMKISFCENFMT